MYIWTRPNFILLKNVNQMFLGGNEESIQKQVRKYQQKFKACEVLFEPPLVISFILLCYLAVMALLQM